MKIGPYAAIPLLLAAACGEPPPPPPPPQPAAAPAPEPEPEPEPTTDGDGDGGGGAGGGPAVEVEKPKPSGRPAVVMGPKALLPLTPIGSTPGSVLKLTGGASLKIPEFSLSRPYKMEFRIAEAKAPSKGDALGGTIARLVIKKTDKDEYGTAVSSGEAFEVRWPMGDESTVNLAVGKASSEDDAKVTWRVVAPAYTVPPEAYFKLDELGPVLYLHATTAPSD